MPEYDELPKLRTYKPNFSGKWRVIVYHDDVRTFEQILFGIIFAINVTMWQAWNLTKKIIEQDTTIIFEGEYLTAEKVAEIMRQTGILVELDEA